MPDKVTIPSLTEVIKNCESFDEEFIKDRLGIISSTSNEENKLALEDKKLDLKRK